MNSRYKSFKGKKKDILNYNNDEEGLDVLRKLSIMAKLKTKLKFRVSFFSNIDSKVNICKRIKLSTYQVLWFPFFRVKVSSYPKELALTLSPLLRHISWMIDLILENSIMQDGLISELLFYRSIIKCFLSRKYPKMLHLKKACVISFILLYFY